MRKDAATRRQRAIEFAAQGLAPRDIAERIGMSDRTVRTYLSDPTAVAELRKVQEERLRALARRATALAEGALAVLWKVAKDDAQPAPARVAASRAILETTLRMTEVADLAERVSALEERAATTRPQEAKRWGG